MTYTTTYVELSRLLVEYQTLVNSTACEDSVIQEYGERRTPIQEAIDEVTSQLTTKIEHLRSTRPRLQDARAAELKLRLQVTELTEECTLLPETVSNLDKVRDSIIALEKCPGLPAAQFHIPMWTERWVQVTQHASQTDDEIDAEMNRVCHEEFGNAELPARAAEIAEIEANSILKMPQNNTAEVPLIGSCPLCAGESDEETGLTNAAHHGRICWDTGALLDPGSSRGNCCEGARAVLCVYVHGIRNTSRSDMP